jgi:RNA polymerase sporulation-specific sigma factor
MKEVPMNEKISDLSALVLQVKSGNEEAFSRLADHFRPALLAMIDQFSIPDGEKEDLMQEGLIGLFKAARLFDPALSSFSTFARICIRSALLDGVKKYNHSTPLPSLDEMEIQVLAPDHLSPDRILLGKENLAEWMERVDRSLSPMERRIFGLKLQGKSTEEISKVMGKDKKSVENSLYRLRKKLFSGE